jgi:predicted ester cyclase
MRVCTAVHRNAARSTLPRVSEDNKALVKRFLDALTNGDVAGAAACFDAERYYSHSWGGDLAATWERMKAARRAGRLTFVEGESVALVADGDRVVHHSFARMRHTGDAFGVATTGREVTFHSLEIWRVADGKIVEHWGGEREAERLYEQLAGECR